MQKRLHSCNKNLEGGSCAEACSLSGTRAARARRRPKNGATQSSPTCKIDQDTGLLPKLNGCETYLADREVDELNVHPEVANNVGSILLMRRVLLLLGKFIPQDCRYRFTTAEDAPGPCKRRSSITLIMGASLSAPGISSQISERSASSGRGQARASSPHGGIAGAIWCYDWAGLSCSDSSPRLGVAISGAMDHRAQHTGGWI